MLPICSAIFPREALRTASLLIQRRTQQVRYLFTFLAPLDVHHRCKCRGVAPVPGTRWYVGRPRDTTQWTEGGRTPCSFTHRHLLSARLWLGAWKEVVLCLGPGSILAAFRSLPPALPQCHQMTLIPSLVPLLELCPQHVQEHLWFPGTHVHEGVRNEKSLVLWERRQRALQGRAHRPGRARDEPP